MALMPRQKQLTMLFFLLIEMVWNKNGIVENNLLPVTVAFSTSFLEHSAGNFGSISTRRSFYMSHISQRSSGHHPFLHSSLHSRAHHSSQLIIQAAPIDDHEEPNNMEENNEELKDSQILNQGSSDDEMFESLYNDSVGRNLDIVSDDTTTNQTTRTTILSDSNISNSPFQSNSLEDSSSSVVSNDLDWRITKVKLEEEHTKSFLRSKPRKLPYEDSRRWVQANLGPDTKEEFFDLVANGNLRTPYIPKQPEEFYTERGTWISWDHFLKGALDSDCEGDE